MKRDLLGHEVCSFAWLADIQNGALLPRAVENGFEVFTAMDSNLDYQQELSSPCDRSLFTCARLLMLAVLMAITSAESKVQFSKDLNK